VQGEINALQKQIATRKNELGAVAWELFCAKRLTEQELVAICEAIAQAEEQIAEKEKVIESIRQESLPIAEPLPVATYGHICPKERIRLPDHAVFCPSCGSKAVDISPPTAKVCSNCGTSVSENAAFCPNCGGRIERAESNAQLATLPKCVHCGAMLEPGVAFCTTCGRKVTGP
jgi:predicted RNA-binding Zn-ribbon protein involved in translation (DUF1610 family)